ncbi:MAG TPA: hypothetical protein VLV54_08115 [Thermoanaerobaculia bacterium]|nr:hypothetical protein [Thermoanaerobaculia bacterium]
MKAKLIIASPIAVILILAFCLLASSPAPQPKTPPVDFATQIRPILEKRCQPCHFTGGTMYQKMPFDRPKTIHTLGEKMFTRIKEPKEQAILRAFLAQRVPLNPGEPR